MFGTIETIDTIIQQQQMPAATANAKKKSSDSGTVDIFIPQGEQPYAGEVNPKKVAEFRAYADRTNKKFFLNIHTGIVHHADYIVSGKNGSQIDEAITAGHLIAAEHPAELEQYQEQRRAGPLHYSELEKHFELTNEEADMFRIEKNPEGRSKYKAFLKQCNKQGWNYAVDTGSGQIMSTRYRNIMEELSWFVLNNKTELALAATYKEALEKGGEYGTGLSLPKEVRSNNQ